MTPNAPNKAKLIGVGLGPGDPELVTVKAARLLASAKHIAYFAKSGRKSHARNIASNYVTPDVNELPLLYPITTEISFAETAYTDRLAQFYEESAQAIKTLLSSGHDVALLCEGDPLLYGSFMHMFMRIKDAFDVEICAGLSGMSGCFAAAKQPMTWGDDVLTVLPATLSEEKLISSLEKTDAAVLMKLGGNFPKLRRIIELLGLAQRAIYVERGTMANERILPFSEKLDDEAPYFSMILIPGEGRRP
ncbi:MAG: precorrin-2 C(20)-methyltransferase [Methylocystaceae bacterium]|jgi:precorrin-2/cobalt-factor-2 C20-methyltransferase|nr:precorrin-2 C(20)-methyltransferase [Methylocystaceae bacterium]NBT97091.1 precorrin-2 C(20)-methyltransferase [Methylocystaceae bacterium]